LRGSKGGEGARDRGRTMTRASTRATWSAPGRKGCTSAAAAVTPVREKLKMTVATASQRRLGCPMAAQGEEMPHQARALSRSGHGRVTWRGSPGELAHPRRARAQRWVGAQPRREGAQA
jgi:hypothetical protein